MFGKGKIKPTDFCVAQNLPKSDDVSRTSKLL